MDISTGSLNLARAALDSLVDPCAVLRPERDYAGRVVDLLCLEANVAACRFFDIAYSDILGIRLSATQFTPADRELFSLFAAAVDAGEPVDLHDFAWSPASKPQRVVRFDLHVVPVAGLLMVSWRDSSERQQAAVALAAAERRYRMLAQNTSDIVLETDAEHRVIWVSPSLEKVLGLRPEEWSGLRVRELVIPDELDRIIAARDEFIATEGRWEGAEFRFRTRSGDSRWMQMRAQIIREGDRIVGSVGGLRDIHQEVLLRRAVTTLSAANRAIVRAADEDEMLHALCEIAVGEAGYVLAWYGRRVDDERHSVLPVAISEAHRDYVEELDVTWGPGVLGQGPAGTCLREGTVQLVEDFTQAESYKPWLAPATARGFRSSLSVPVFVDGHLDGAFMVYAAEPYAFDAAALGVMDDLAAQVGAGLSRLRALRLLRRSVDERRLLSTAIDQAAEAIVVTDVDANIIYANPAAMRISGYEAHEVLGRNPRLFQSGLHEPRFYDEMWRRLLGGHSWHGVLMNRRKNGEYYEEEATIAPVHDEDGKRIAYVAVKHDLSRERRLQEVVDREQLDRDAILEVMRDVRQGDSLMSTAANLAAVVRRFDGIDGCMIVTRTVDGGVVPIAIEGAAVPELHRVGVPLHNARLDLMLEISLAGPWWMDLRDPDGIAATDPEFTSLMRSAGFTATGYAPIRWEDEVIGVVCTATMSPVAHEWMPQRQAVLAEVGSFAGMLMGPQANEHSRRESRRAEIQDIIEHHRFHVVFEPVMHLPSSTIVGYEALTRFDDGAPPETRFELAQEVGLGSALELACARTALRDAAALPAHAWVAVNFSPSTLVEGAATALIADVERQVIIEITEHNLIENYAAVRRAIAECGSALIAVDDAGSGFASLRHILELQPDIIKLDRALVRDIDADPARQALAAGMRHFAALTGTTLIAEGVENTQEAAAIRQLGVELAQGYLFHED